MNRVSGSFNKIHVLSFIFSRNLFNLISLINPESGYTVVQLKSIGNSVPLQSCMSVVLAELHKHDSHRVRAEVTLV